MQVEMEKRISLLSFSKLKLSIFLSKLTAFFSLLRAFLRPFFLFQMILLSTADKPFSKAVGSNSTYPFNSTQQIHTQKIPFELSMFFPFLNSPSKNPRKDLTTVFFQTTKRTMRVYEWKLRFHFQIRMYIWEEHSMALLGILWITEQPLAWFLSLLPPRYIYTSDNSLKGQTFNIAAASVLRPRVLHIAE